MYLPTTYMSALLLAIFTMLCWGSWANTQKLTGRWRFEFFYLDYSLGVLVCAGLAALTLGSLNSAEITAIDGLQLASLRKSAWGFAGGAVFNLANMLLVAAIAIAGLSVAFPIAIGLALVIGVAWNYGINPQGHPALLFGGAALVAAAIVVDAMAYRLHARSLKAAVPVAAPAPAPLPKLSRGRTTATPPRAARPTPAKGIALSLVSGVLMGSFYPMVEMGKSGDNGLPAYSIALIFAMGVFFSTLLYSIFFALLPTQGEALRPSDYLRGTGKQHLLGLAGGVIWMAGTIANFAAASAPSAVRLGPAVSYGMGQGATLISALWGLLVWREFAGANSRVRMLLTAMLLLFVGGLVLISIAPLYGQ